MAANPKLAMMAASHLKKHWEKYVTCGCLVAILPIFLIVTIISSLFSWLSWRSDEPDQLEPYQTLAEQYGLAWEELLALDLGYHEMDLDNLDIYLVKDAFVYEEYEMLPIYRYEYIDVYVVRGGEIEHRSVKIETNEIDYYDIEVPVYRLEYLDIVVFDEHGDPVTDESGRIQTDTITIVTDDIEYYERGKVEIKTRSLEEAMDYLMMDDNQRELTMEALELLLEGEGIE